MPKLNYARSFGYRARTRDMYSQSFRKTGNNFPLSHMLEVLKVGDYVDIKANAAVHKGMPHRFYHGRTGVVFDVTRRSIGVEVNKQVRNKILKKRIHIRIEHARKSRCREDFLRRVQDVDSKKREAKISGTNLPIEELKRFPGQPRKAYFVDPTSSTGKGPVAIAPLPFDDML